MASSLGSDRPNLPAPGDTANDPFVTSPSSTSHHRYSSFDQDLFAAGPGSSPRQAKRVLEAHLAETTRRLDEAGKLGTALVAQRKTLTDQLQEIDKVQAEAELNPELRLKLVDVEKDFNDLARESARALLPKQRVPSNETNPGSPYVPEGRSGRRSVSPSKFESHATGSPSKLSVPNRKIRNQPATGVQDMEFYADISNTLIAQVRNLQAALSEREEEVRELQIDKSRLEDNSENLHQRIKALDENEHRYKEENWNLETRLQEDKSKEKEAADRERKLTQSLNLTNAEKTAAQKELDEVKLSHSKLSEEHAAAVKQHDIELGTAKRNMVMADGERTTLQRKIDDLTNQNQELAKAFSTQRGRVMERESLSGMSDEDFDTANDNVTPEHSPPPSPVKGTPRHSILESETIKTSLHHAQRTIQSQRSLLHREKTEKLELRRMIQDLRDEVEKYRDGGGSSANRRSRKAESKEFKKPHRLLGSFRSGKEQVFMDDPEWEENHGGSPRVSSANVSPVSQQAGDLPGPIESSDAFETANEASESAFETANERGTETEGFQTGNENFSDSDGVATETEGSRKGFGRMRRPPSLPAGLSRHMSKDSFHSTASTSDDEDTYGVMTTPTTTLNSQRSRGRLNRNTLRGSRQVSEEPMRSSPASFASSAGTPQAGQSLFAELQDLGASDDESLGAATPSRRSTRSLTPGSTRRESSPPPAVPALPKVVMVDAGIMTEPVRVTPEPIPIRLSTIEESDRPKSMESVVGPGAARTSMSWLSAPEEETDRSRPVSSSYSDASAQHEPDMEKELARFPAPPTAVTPPPELSLSNIQAESVEPREEVHLPPTPPALSLTSIIKEHVEPISEPDIPAPALSLSTIMAHNLEPKAEPDVPLPELTLTTLHTEAVEPVAEPEIALPALSMSSILGQHVHPVNEPEPAVVEAPVPEPATLSLSTVQTESVEPVGEPEVPVSLPKLSLVPITASEIEPVNEPEVTVPLPKLSMIPITASEIAPVADPEPAPPALGLSSIKSENWSPVHERTTTPAKFGYTTIESVETMPISPRNGWREAFILPRDKEGHAVADREPPETPTRKVVVSLGDRPKPDSPTFIAEDDTRQSARNTPDAETPESQRPFKEISSNSLARPLRKQPVATFDQGAQTSLTADAIDKLTQVPPKSRHQKNLSADSIGSIASGGTVRIHRSQESLNSLSRDKGKIPDITLVGADLRRPGSAASGRGSIQDAPPLPSNHKELIEAARSSSSHGAPGSMGPPLWPASALKQRPRTPSQTRPMSPASAQGTPTPRAVRSGSTQGRVEVQSPTRLTARSRQSSVSSFASELDNRFNMRPGEMGIDPSGFGANTDPRMIQAITQTMIGEYLWKYTRKTGRGEMSEKRHRRYFWVHPYTRTLYWSDSDPSSGARSELKAKSVPIEAVRVVTDDNPMPPGLHRKSLVIISPGRTIKFTCTTGQRHETWFNALSYLLLRTNTDAQTETEEMAGNITREDVDEFNPQYGRRAANGTRPRPPPSLSSYNSRTTRDESPAHEVSLGIPHLTPTSHRGASATSRSGGTLGKLSGYWRSSGQKPSSMFSSLRGRAPSAQNVSIYEASEVHDSAEDLREMIERQDRESDRLENVRACCDGKHDVGTLHHHSRRGRGSQSHAHPGTATTPTPMSSTRSRA